MNIAKADKLKNVCVDPEELEEIQSIINTVTDNEVMFTTTCEFSSNGNPFKLTGTSLLDINGDSCKTSDAILPYTKFALTDPINGDRYFFTKENGQYSYNIMEGDFTYSPELIFGNHLFTTFPENRMVSFPTDGIEVIQDFCVIPNPEEVDAIEVHLIPLEVARPGFDTDYMITYTNTGNIIRGGDIVLTFPDELVDIESSAPMVDVEEAGILTWSFENMLPFETRNIEFTVNLNSPMDTPALNGGDILSYKAEVAPPGNQSLDLYRSFLEQEVVNSFDPNDKTCLNGNTFDQELVGDYLKYMIRFENTGTAEAVNIVITDTLDDTKYDVRTLQVINASHDVETELVDNVIKFIFKDIYLPFEDETNDGFVTFRIKTMPSLVLGDDIRNKAEIFFDFNFPIVTNTTSTVISDFTSIADIDQESFELFVSPNPTTEVFYLESEVPFKEVELWDMNGRLIEKRSFVSFETRRSYPVEHLSSGVYAIKVRLNGDFITKKIVVK